MNDKYHQQENWLNQIKSRIIDFTIKEGEFDSHPDIIKIKKSNQEIKIIVMVVAIISIGLTLIPSLFSKDDPTTLWRVITTSIIPILVFAVGFRSAKKHSARATIKKAIALKNNLKFTQCGSHLNGFNSPFEQSISGYVHRRKDLVVGDGDMEFGDIRYETGGRNSKVYRNFYIEQKLPFNVQTLAIDSLSESGFAISRAQNPNLVSLEGDFYKYFTIETEDLYKSQATAFLAPDLMSYMIDNFQKCEIEFFDNKVRFIFSKTADTLSEIEANYLLVDKFLKKFADKFKLLEVDRKEEDVVAVNNVQDFLQNNSRHSKIYLIWYVVWFLVAFLGILFVKNVHPILMVGISLFVALSLGSIFGIVFAGIKDHSTIKKAQFFNSRIRATVKPLQTSIIIALIATVLVLITSGFLLFLAQDKKYQPDNFKGSNAPSGKMQNRPRVLSGGDFAEVLSEISAMKESDNIVWSESSVSELKSRLTSKGRAELAENLEFINAQAGLSLGGGRIYILKGVVCTNNGTVTTRSKSLKTVLMTLTSSSSGKCEEI